MNQISELLQGPIARDYREILESVPAFETATKAKKVKTGKNCSEPTICPAPNTGKNCSEGKICPAPNTGRNCSEPHVCPKKKKAADVLDAPVPGWSLPPAPPSA